MMNLLLTGQ